MHRFSMIGNILIAVGMFASACGPTERFDPTLTPLATDNSSSAPSPTLSISFTPTPTPTLTPTPTPIGSGGQWLAYTDIKIISAPKGEFLYNIFKLDLFDPAAPPINLTDNEDPNIGYMYPAWSPDGKRIAFDKVTTANSGKKKSELFLMDENGQNMQVISPVLAPQNGVNLHDLIYDWEPSWSPDGTEIVFSSNRSTLSSDPNNYQLFIMDLRTFEIRQLTHLFGSCETPAWSPDGSTIAFMSNQTGSYDIWTIQTDGTMLKRVTTSTSADRFPRWSPDGKKIIFHSERDQNFELFTVSLESGNLTQLTNDPAIDVTAQYSPDGKWIIFQSDRDGLESLYIMDTIGNQVEKISKGDDINVNGSWQPR